MINISKLQEDIWEVLSTLTTAPLLISEQENYSPADNYAVFKIKHWEQIGSSNSEHIGGTSAEYTNTTLWKFCLRVTGVGVDSNQILMEIAQRLNRETIKYSWSTIGITYQYTDSIKPYPYILATGWEQRYAMDVYFNMTIEDVENIGYIEFIDVTTTVKDETNNTVISNHQIVDIVP